MKTQLTKKQIAVLDFIQEHISELGYAPTLRELAAHFGFKAVGTVKGYIKALTAKGYIKQNKDRARTMTVINYINKKNSLPILGCVAAGKPIFSPENFNGELPCSKLVRKPDNTFALKVIGDSMIEAGILDGDFVLVQKQKTAQNRDIVVAMIDDEVTVKRFFKDNDKCIRLVPENKTMKPYIIKPPATTYLLGKVVGVYRVL